MENASDTQRRSGLAVAGLIVGIVALLTSLMPIINNISFFIALVGAVLAVAGLVGCLRGKRAGKGLAIAAVAVNVVAVVAVLASQSMYGAAIDDAMNGPQAVDVSSDAKQGDDAGKPEDTAKVLSVGSSVELENGMVVAVDSVTPGLSNYDGSAITCVRVTYTNKGGETLSFNPYDWKGESASGVRSDIAYYSEASEELNSGDLAAGGTVSGNLYFKGDLTAALYFSKMLADEPAATWQLA